MSAARDRPAARAHGCSGLQGLMVPPSRDGSPLYDTNSMRVPRILSFGSTEVCLFARRCVTVVCNAVVELRFRISVGYDLLFFVIFLIRAGTKSAGGCDNLATSHLNFVRPEEIPQLPQFIRRNSPDDSLD